MPLFARPQRKLKRSIVAKRGTLPRHSAVLTALLCTVASGSTQCADDDTANRARNQDGFQTINAQRQPVNVPPPAQPIDPPTDLPKVVTEPPDNANSIQVSLQLHGSTKHGVVVGILDTLNEHSVDQLTISIGEADLPESLTVTAQSQILHRIAAAETLRAMPNLHFNLKRVGDRGSLQFIIPATEQTKLATLIGPHLSQAQDAQVIGKSNQATYPLKYVAAATAREHIVKLLEPLDLEFQLVANKKVNTLTMTGKPELLAITRAIVQQLDLSRASPFRDE